MKRQLFTIISLVASVLVFSQVAKTDILQDLEKSQPGNQEFAITATLKSSSRLFEIKEDLTSVILVIPSGSVVKITGSDSTYYRVVYGEDEGFIFKKHAVINDTPVLVEPVKKQVEPVNNQQPEQKQVTRYSYLEDKYGPTLAPKLYANKIWRGMTAQMVRDSWGTPLKVNRNTDQTLPREEWVYKKAVLIIENNTLVDWQEPKNN